MFGTADRANAWRPAKDRCRLPSPFPLILFPSYKLSGSDRPGAVKGAALARRSEPLTARTDLKSYEARERGFRPDSAPGHPLRSRNTRQSAYNTTKAGTSAGRAKGTRGRGPLSANTMPCAKSEEIPLAGRSAVELSYKQLEAILPGVQRAVDAQIALWEASREVERVLGQELDGLEDSIATFATCNNHVSTISELRDIMSEVNSPSLPNRQSFNRPETTMQLSIRWLDLDS